MAMVATAAAKRAAAAEGGALPFLLAALAAATKGEGGLAVTIVGVHSLVWGYDTVIYFDLFVSLYFLLCMTIHSTQHTAYIVRILLLAPSGTAGYLFILIF